MPKFSDLPSELVLEVCDFLLSGSPKTLERAFAGESNAYLCGYDICKAIRQGWKDVLNLSCSSRRYRELLVDQHNHVYRTIAVGGYNNFKQLLSLLRFLDKKPELATGVKTLYLTLIPEFTTSYMAELQIDDLKLIRTQAAAANISYSKNLWTKPKPSEKRICRLSADYDYDYGEMCDCEYCMDMWDDCGDFDEEEPHASCDYERMGMLTSLILHKMKGLEQFGCSISKDSFSMVGDGKQCSLPILPELQYLAIAKEFTEHEISPNDFKVLTGLGNTMTHLCLSDIGPVQGHVSESGLRIQKFENIAHLVLTGMAFCNETLCEFLDDFCGPLTSFKFLPEITGMTYWDFAYEVTAMPQEVVDALLPKHADSLRTLCIDFTWFHDDDFWFEREVIDTLEGFVNLESLWIDCDCISVPWFGDDSDNDSEIADADVFGRPKNVVIEDLPRNLRQIYFAGGLENIMPDLARLAANSNVFPRLESIELDRNEKEIVETMTAKGFKPSLATVKRATMWDTE
ncbi:hypothetical protein CkaCkLH20_13233 [Colletotrichum karsti]|uniref:Uncharacterized protein n=1 Tax=Colletotrichum karsti TaxID=1095194 RepID=A0A9P6HW21_9PEZI|nr:uncharacterized protein CkaCkLH20_13233 [Colletotrichum karsti]KAF9869316.1 hypothetical protein CkaCkLH20_13233 [Colletotrichum karsti]